MLGKTKMISKVEASSPKATDATSGTNNGYFHVVLLESISLINVFVG